MTHARRIVATAALASVVALMAGALVGFAPTASAVGQADPPNPRQRVSARGRRPLISWVIACVESAV